VVGISNGCDGLLFTIYWKMILIVKDFRALSWKDNITAISNSSFWILPFNNRVDFVDDKIPKVSSRNFHFDASYQYISTTGSKLTY